MDSKILLRISSILIGVHGLLHSIGHSAWKAATDPLEQNIIHTMCGQSFVFMGRSRSLGDYFEGYGYACSVAMILIAVLYWLLSSEINSMTGKLTFAISIGLIAWAGIEWNYFFPLAAAMTGTAAICGLIACLILRKKNSNIKPGA
jgi:hypothetical protein